MTAEFFELLGINYLLVSLLMTILWGFYWQWQNAGVVDIGWALSFVLMTFGGVLFGSGDPMKKWALASMLVLWGGRLAWHLIVRFQPTIEDPRYTELKEKLGSESLDFKVYLMFQFQGMLIIFLFIPLLIVFGYAGPRWSFFEFFGIAVWAIGFWGEALADSQLKSCKEQQPGKVCQNGLWKYSRHPNYFFEWIVWIGYGLFAYPSAGLISVLPPLAMLILLTRISGIPQAEAQSLKTKGEEYQDYQKKTSAFIPWFL